MITFKYTYFFIIYMGNDLDKRIEETETEIAGLRFKLNLRETLLKGAYTEKATALFFGFSVEEQQKHKGFIECYVHSEEYRENFKRTGKPDRNTKWIYGALTLAALATQE